MPFIKFISSTIYLGASRAIGDVLNVNANDAATAIDRGIAVYDKGAQPIVTRPLPEVSVNIKRRGAMGDGVTDDTDVWQAAINFAVPLGIKIIAPAGNYKITRTLTSPAGFKPLVIEGEAAPERSSDACGTRLNGSTIGANPILKVKGGSGRLSQGYVENVTFIGGGASAGGVGVLLEACCGHRIINCAFESVETAVQFKNATSGEFTEFCTVERSRATSVRHAMRYTRAAGNDSFHGTGALDFTVSGTSGYAAVLIEGSGSADPLVYNAPMEITVFTSSKLFEAQAINGANVRMYTYGTIRLEREGIEVLTDNGTNVLLVHHLGELIALGQPLNATGRFYCSDVLWRAGGLVGTDGFNGQTYQRNRTYRARKTGVTSGGTIALVRIKPERTVALLAVRVTRSNAGTEHERCYVLSYYPNPTGTGGSIVVMATHAITDVPGIGAVTFTVDSSDNLVCTQANLTTYPCTIEVNGINVFPGRGEWWHDQS